MDVDQKECLSGRGAALQTDHRGSGRPPVVCLHGCTSSSQPLATAIGLDLLKRGGNAADAAVAMAAALSVTEPSSTGPGGDAFCLFYNGITGDVSCINGSGRSPRAQTLELLEGRGYSAEGPPPAFHALNVTVSLSEVLGGAVDLAEEGFPVAMVAAHQWARWVEALRHAGKELDSSLLVDGWAPRHGHVFRNPALARTLRELGECGKQGFYQGRVAQAIVDVIHQNGGVMTLDDLSSHDSEVVTPISTDYKGVRLWEPPPNSQGTAALLLLNILENFPLKEVGHNSPDYVHLLVEAVRLALTDSLRNISDPDHGNACSFVNSTYMGFGSGLNRGASFSLQSNHSNCIAGGKRPYHTIMAALVTGPAPEAHKPRLLAALGVVGAMMQPQGHVQVLLNMLEFGMDPQQALDAPRVFVEYDPKADQWQVNLEEGFSKELSDELKRRGHRVNWPITGFTRSLGLALLPLALCCILANLLLLFPMGEISYLQQDRLASYIWYCGGLGGGGLLRSWALGPWGPERNSGPPVPSEPLLRCGTLGLVLTDQPVLAALVGLVGSGYCFILSGMTLLQGPQCNTLTMGWTYPFSDEGGRYLLEPESWSECLQPERIVEWNVTLLCVLLGLAALEFLICLLQLSMGLVNAVCRPCCYKQQYSLNVA
ncbi:hypothetical protein NHX12_032986 [Muraenolepis orangiensis]|uniref:Uncharacterized protein n=1 Tax=Muraenolepis orangiensis TaxID=630683 RepID=A0A9Q0IIA7_9TELE|nr:hypothetical protein NHX12_032986 [Muraenolepis orangiensis]